MNATAQATSEKTETKPATGRRWAPRFWLGCEFPGWVRLLARNRFAIGLPYSYIAAIDTFFSVINSGMRLATHAVYGRKIARTEIKDDPIFVIGHWRSGTTLLHELLVLDERFTYPNNYACFAPNHFLFTERLADRWLKFILPTHRPMDDMSIGWNSPQEDEFALCNLGLPSPYCTFAFPNHAPQYQEYLDLEGLTPAQLARWKRVFLWFLKQITMQNAKRIVLKSPPHTSRIKVLLEMFPDARFVHIVRNPYVVYSSTINMLKRMYAGQGFQTPRFDGLEEHVLNTYVRMNRTLDETRSLVPEGRFYQLRYEDLVADPFEQLNHMYDRLEMGSFEPVAPAVRAYQDARSDYRPKQHQLEPEIREQISTRWGEFIEKYGYSAEPARV